MVREAREHLAGLGIDVDPRDAHGLAADRPAAADRARPRALLRRAHHHPRRADLGALAAGGRAAVRRAAPAQGERGRSFVFISHFLDDILRDLRRRSRSSATAARSSPAPVAGIDKGWVIERMIGAGHEELEESYTGEFTLDTQARRAGRAGGERPRPSSAPSATSRSTCAPARFSASTASWAAAQLELPRALFGKIKPARHARARRRARSASRNTAAARRAGIAFVPESRRSMLFHHEPIYKNVSIAILERISRLWLKPRGRARDRRAPRREPAASRPPSVDALLGTSPAATSRRWRWRNG